METTLLDAALIEVQTAVDEGNTYSALQLFHSRFIRLRRRAGGDLAAEFCLLCADVLNDGGDSAGAADVLNQLLKAAGEGSPAPKGARTTIPLDVGGVQKAAERTADPEKALGVLKTLLKVAGKVAPLSEAEKAALHCAIGGRFRQLGDLGNALRHLRRGKNAVEHVDALRELCAAGYVSEECLFVCREVLQTLHEVSMQTAEAFLEAWKRQDEQGKWEADPLSTLTELTMEIIKSDAGGELRRKGFEVVLHVYNPVLERDGGLRNLLMAIGEKFGLVPKSEAKTPNIAALLGNLLRT
eukprot:scaffold470_cov257-Pinguiococcus_pyrenoidosus.AAC.15